MLIIGAGISGALVADELTAHGLSVLMIDRRGPIRGSSCASTALLQAELDLPLTLLARKLGETDAMRHYLRSKLAVSALAERVRRYGIDAEFVARDTLYLSGDVLDPAGLEREAAARNGAGLEATVLSRRELKRSWGLQRAGALLTHGNFAANPVKLTAGILNSAFSRGATCLSPMTLETLHEHPRHVEAVMKSGETIHARFVVYATGYELPFAISKKAHQLHSTWAIATRPQKRALWPGECLIWEASDPYLYLRTTTDGRIICGGEDEDFEDEAARDSLTGRKTRALERRLAQLFPHVDARADYAWTGTFGATPDGTPSIGFLPRHQRTLAVLGYGGNGFTFSMIGAQIIRGLIIDGEAPHSDLYAFRRPS